MRVKGNAQNLASGTTKFVDDSAVWVFNTGSSAIEMTVRNPADSGNVGSIYVGAGAGIIVTLGVGEGLRGTNDLKGTPIVAAGF